MSKEYYRKRLIDLRESKRREMDAKKRDNERYASLIKSASTPSAKASYRKSKVSASESHTRRIESIKREIERTQDLLRRC